MMNIQLFAAATGKVVTIKNELKVLGSNLVAVDGASGIEFDVKNYPNDRLMFVFQNTHASTAKNGIVLAPTNGGYAAEDTDITTEIAAGGIGVAYVETAKYVNNNGKIICKGSSTDIKVVAVVLGK